MKKAPRSLKCWSNLLKAGHCKKWRPKLSPDTRFYILGLAPNASRLSIRFWLDTTFGQLAQNLAQHWQDLAIEPRPWKTPPSIWRLLLQTAVLGKSENISPVLAGEMTRAVIAARRTH
ncbi:CRISPR-associated protein Cas8c/Csd1, subtype I-C/DVULG [Cardiobacterium valvarum]|uniref:CRISPR-associated protein Cas8c/Csd1, subtype I-C/DVULG n=1 Tax=Cardiobacterium valvarum TaxID=194702 RepID=A0A381I3Z0_9GAMM|nr:CRISPR-associated protein Cas8c/Csd1, subtype I-C/DVULG [Cardiobacterium valvarum]SUY08081.1 CRISPR-associated protein Cas8c/Csd1, subtype I-C/DVULG [Cardiobacterium valvarum]